MQGIRQQAKIPVPLPPCPGMYVLLKDLKTVSTCIQGHTYFTNLSPSVPWSLQGLAKGLRPMPTKWPVLGWLVGCRFHYSSEATETPKWAFKYLVW